MSITKPIIQSGTRKLLLNESVLSDMREPLSFSIPTVAGKEFIIRFVMIHNEVPKPMAEFTKNEPFLLEITGTFADVYPAVAGTINAFPVNIAGSSYSMAFMINKLLGTVFRIELSLFEG